MEVHRGTGHTPAMSLWHMVRHSVNFNFVSSLQKYPLKSSTTNYTFFFAVSTACIVSASANGLAEAVILDYILHYTF